MPMHISIAHEGNAAVLTRRSVLDGEAETETKASAEEKTSVANGAERGKGSEETADGNGLVQR